MQYILEDRNFTQKIHDTIQLNFPSWLQKQPKVILNLNNLPKAKLIS